MPGSFIQFGQDLNRTEITHRDFNARRMWGGDLIPVLFGINLVNQQIILIYLSLKNWIFTTNSDLYIFASNFLRPWICQTMNSVGSNKLWIQISNIKGLHHQVSKEIGISKLKFVGKATYIIIEKVLWKQCLNEWHF